MSRALLLVVALLLAGCAAVMNTPLSNVEPGARSAQAVDADKLACWQHAEGAHPLTGSLIGMRVGLSYAAYAVPAYRDEENARNRAIEQTAEACMVQRGYTLRPR